ncbi:MAG: copper oxidase, partial [Thermodesulfobacteriota bacterium]
MEKNSDTLRIDRRTFLARAAALGSGTVLLRNVHAAASVHTHGPGLPRETTTAAERDKPLLDRIDPKPTLPPGEPGKDYTPVITPNNVSLPWKLVDGVKVYHLVAEEVEHEFAPSLRAHCWGFNGRVHGPTIEAV